MTDGAMRAEPQLCAHCGWPARGYASMNGLVLCHPPDGTGLDCYRLVTVYGEQVGSRNPNCPGCGTPIGELPEGHTYAPVSPGRVPLIGRGFGVSTRKEHSWHR